MVQDGRAYLESCQESYDLIVLDAFDGLEIPASLRTRQFYQLTSQRLASGGVVVSNLHRRSPSYHRDRKTLAAVFPEQLVFTGTGVAIVLSSPEPIQRQEARPCQGWGFEPTTLLDLRELQPDVQKDAIPFDDPQ